MRARSAATSPHDRRTDSVAYNPVSSSLLLGLLLSLGGTASAQELSPGLFHSDTAAASRPTLQPVDTASRRDFRWLGTAIGAAGLGLAAGLEARAYCGNSENGPRDCAGLTTGVGFLGAAVGGAVGHLVGRAIHR
jgi:hypothetical protein